jgi:hypothetical protein
MQFGGAAEGNSVAVLFRTSAGKNNLRQPPAQLTNPV